MTTTRACRPPTRPPVALLLTSDTALHQQITDLATDQHLTITTVTDPHDLRRAWATAALVLLGTDQLPACRRAALPPRPGVIVVACAVPHDQPTLRRDAETLGARHLAVLPAAWTWLADQLAHPPHPSRPTGQPATAEPARVSHGAGERRPESEADTPLRHATRQPGESITRAKTGTPMNTRLRFYLDDALALAEDATAATTFDTSDPARTTDPSAPGQNAGPS
jgi:hypothetical protein